MSNDDKRGKLLSELRKRKKLTQRRELLLLRERNQVSIM